MIWFLIKLAIAIYFALNLISYAIILLLNKNISKRMFKKRICILIAHPDDECMFFGPIIRQLSKCSNKFYVLCMTTGDFYGKGNIRIDELKLSCQNLIGDINLVDVKVVNETNLPDHPKFEWDKNLCAKIIRNYIHSNSIDVLITFDSRGVSSHLNHCFLYAIVKSLDLNEKIQFYYMETVSLARKYLFLFDLLPTLYYSNNLIAINSPDDYRQCFKSMMNHQSQLVWFRWLYILTSRYMIINSLKIRKLENLN